MLPAATAKMAAQQIDTIIQRVSQIILGKEDVVRLAVTCLMARGHLLFEDQPGVGKTLLSQALAQALGLQLRSPLVVGASPLTDTAASAHRLVEAGGGTVVKTDRWGRRRFAYEINHKWEGIYVVLDISTEGRDLSEVERVLHLASGFTDGGDILTTPGCVMIGLSARTDRTGAEARTRLAHAEEAVRPALAGVAQRGGDAQAIRKAQTALRNAAYYDHARSFARHVAQYSQRCKPADQLFICTGGGPGIMEAANRGAHDVGAPTVGLNIALPHEQHANPYVSPELSFKFHYFAMRKMHFLMRAKALLAFPGGFGTLDELFEVLTLVQCGKAKPLPIFLFGSAYWSRLIDFQVLVEEGTISEQDLKLFHLVDDPMQAWEGIRHFYQLPEA